MQTTNHEGTTDSPQAPAPLPLKELVALLIKHYGFHTGHYDISIEFQIGIGPIGSSADSLLPGAAIGISKIGLAPSHMIGPLSVDAAQVNPAKPKKKR